MIAEAGHFALVLALALALIQSVVPVIGARLRDPALMNVARSTALVQFVFAALSFAATVVGGVSDARSSPVRSDCSNSLLFTQAGCVSVIASPHADGVQAFSPPRKSVTPVEAPSSMVSVSLMLRSS